MRIGNTSQNHKRGLRAPLGYKSCMRRGLRAPTDISECFFYCRVVIASSHGIVETKLLNFKIKQQDINTIPAPRQPVLYKHLWLYDKHVPNKGTRSTTPANHIYNGNWGRYHWGKNIARRASHPIGRTAGLTHVRAHG